MSAEETLKNWRHQTEDVILVPYVQNTAAFTFPEDFLVSLYFRARDEGALDLVFPGMSGEITLNRAIGMLKDKPMVVGLTKPDYNVSGVGWLYEIEGDVGARKASIGFLFFRNGNSGRDARKAKRSVRAIARLALGWWFLELKCDVLFGTVLSTNQVAVNFARSVGFRKFATIPSFFSVNGHLEDATGIVQTKEEFLLHEELPDEQRSQRSGKK